MMYGDQQLPLRPPLPSNAATVAASKLISEPRSDATAHAIQCCVSVNATNAASTDGSAQRATVRHVANQSFIEFESLPTAVPRNTD